MSEYSSYYLYQKYEKRGEQDWIPCYPNTFSMSGDSQNPMPFVLKEEDDTACGYVPCEVEERWVEIPITEDYECGECEAGYQYRYVSCDVSTYTYIGDYKYEILCEQKSSDGGETWVNTNKTKISDTPIEKVGKKVTITMKNGDVFSQSCGNDYGYWNSYVQIPANSVGTLSSIAPASAVSPYYLSETTLQKTSNAITSDGRYFLTYSEQSKALTGVSSVVFGNCVERIGYDRERTRDGTSATEYTLYGGTFKNWYMDNVTFSTPLNAIGSSSFAYNNFTSVTMPSSLRSLGWNVFEGNQFLSEVNLNEGLNSIGYGCFKSCDLLQKIEIPSTVTEIGWHVFNGSPLLQVIFRGSRPPRGYYPVASSSGRYIEYGKMKLDVPSGCKIYVPCGSKSAYNNAFENISGSSIIEYGGNCPSVPSLDSTYRPLYYYRKGNMTNTYYKGLYSSGTQEITTSDVPQNDGSFSEVTVNYNTKVNSGTIKANKLTFLGNTSGYTTVTNTLVFNGNVQIGSTNGSSVHSIRFEEGSNVKFYSSLSNLPMSSITFSTYVELHNNCFADCHLLTDVYITYSGSVIPVVYDNVNHPPFEDCPLRRVHVPCELYDAYKANSFWKGKNILRDTDQCQELPYTKIVATSAVTKSEGSYVQADYEYRTNSMNGSITIDCYDQTNIYLEWAAYASKTCTLTVLRDGSTIGSLAVRYDSGSGQPKMKKTSGTFSIGSGYHRVELVYSKGSGGGEIGISGF